MFIHVQSIIVQELQKDGEQRAEWILYFDSTLVLQHSNFDMRMMLPPVEEVEMFRDIYAIAAEGLEAWWVRVMGWA